jgi:plasmid stability protein
VAVAAALATQRRRMVVAAATKSGAGIKTIHMEPKRLKKYIEAA